MKVGKKKYIKNRLKNNKQGLAPKYYASCYGKIRHTSYLDAKLASSEKPEIVKPYKCQYCQFYHIGRRRE